MTEMITGILTDYALMTEGKHMGRYGVRIDDKPYPVMQHVDVFLVRLQKGERVDANLNKDGMISKIARAKTISTDRPGVVDVAGDAVEQAKRKAAGFGDPTPEIKAPEGGIAGIVAATKERMAQEEKKDCAPSITPVQSGLKTVEGQIVFINPEQHKITLKDRAGETHTFIWPPVMHEKMSGLKQWWFAKLTGEHEADVDLWRLTAQDFFKRPDDWPFQKGGGKGNWQPRNERLIVFQCTYKECCATVRQEMMFVENNFDEAEFNRVMNVALNRAIADAKALIAAETGGQ